MGNLFFCRLARPKDVDKRFTDGEFSIVGICDRQVPFRGDLQCHHEPDVLELLFDQLGEVSVVFSVPVETIFTLYSLTCILI